MNNKKEKIIKKLLLNNIDLEKKIIILNEKEYSKKELFSYTSSFDYNDNSLIYLKYPNIIRRKDIIYNLFELNVSKYTFYGLKLPLIVFLIISLINSSFALLFQKKGNIGFINLNNNQIIFIYFLGILFLIFSIILFIKTYILKEKVYFSRRNGQNRYNHITNKEYNKICKCFERDIYENSIYFKDIESARIKIREFKEKDLNDVYEYASNDNVNKYMSTTSIKSIDEGIEYIENCLINYENGLIYRLAIYEKKLHKVIGYIGLSKKDLSIKTGQVVYALNESFWHQGYMSEALSLFIQYLISIGKNYIIGGHVMENINSGKVLEKNGFIRDEHKDYDLIIDGKKCHIYTYILDLRKKDEEYE